VIAVIVPVMRRPGNAAPFMRSLRSSGAAAAVYAVADEPDIETRQAWTDAGATVLITPTDHRFGPKVNHGYRSTTEPWVLVVGDDVIFHPGWDTAALAAAGDRFHMVATNDMGNPWVLRGEHATHPMIRRTWVDESGACWDGPGVVAHEGYRHAWVDNEWSAKAIAEGVFVFAEQARVEHIHPTWGKGVMDPVYAAGIAALGADGKLFHHRAAEHAR
jgi:hypothetical protein